jgi:hypothetical protein
MLEQILQYEGKNSTKEKKIINHNNNMIKSSNHRNKRIILINSISMPEYEINKKTKNGIEEFCNNISLIKSQENHAKKILQDKLYHINMNKIALFKKIKFAGLKKYCSKDLRLNNGYNNNLKNDINYNYIIHQNNQNIINKNKSWNKNQYLNLNQINNCNEITINSIREKVKNYFIGKFDNIKDYFDDWDEQGIGKISINNIYRYLNNKIKFKISKEDIKKLIANHCKKKYFDLQNFKYFFFEEPSNEKTSIQIRKFLTKNMSDNLKLYKNKNDINLLGYEKYKYKKLLYTVKEQKDKILSEKKSESEEKEEELMIIKI